MNKGKAGQSSSMRLAIVTPTYNEAGNIGKLLRGIQAVSKQEPSVDFEVLVVDDSSPDGTAQKVEELASSLKTKNFSAAVTVRTKKDGLGRAYVYGFKQVLALSPQVDYVLQMDADLSHNPKYIAAFVEQAKAGADFVTASRYIEGGDTPDWTTSRKLLSRSGNMYAKTILGRKISDYTGGYNLYSRELLNTIDLNSLRSGGYGFLIELKYRALTHSRLIAEIPIIFMDRQHGTSKIPKSTMFKSFILVLKIKRTAARKSRG